MAERAAAEETGEGCFLCAHCPSVLFQMVFPERLAVSCPEVRPLPLALVSLLIAEGKREVFPRKKLSFFIENEHRFLFRGKTLGKRSPKSVEKLRREKGWESTFMACPRVRALYIVGSFNTLSDSCQESLGTHIVWMEKGSLRGVRKFGDIHSEVRPVGEAISGTPCRMKMQDSLFKKQEELFLPSNVFGSTCQVFFPGHLVSSSRGHRGARRDRADPRLGLHATTWHMGRVHVTLTPLPSSSCWWPWSLGGREPFSGRRRNGWRWDDVGAKASSLGAPSRVPLDFSHKTQSKDTARNSRREPRSIKLQAHDLSEPRALCDRVGHLSVEPGLLG